MQARDTSKVAAEVASAAALPPVEAASSAPSNQEVQPVIFARRPSKASQQEPATAVNPSTSLQLPFAEQDDDFEAFAKSLHRYQSGVLSL